MNMAKRYVVPLEDNKGLDSPLCPHFGQAKYFAIIRKEDNNVTVEQIVENPRSLGLRPGEYISQLDVDAVIVPGGIGMKALQLLTNRGIELYQTQCTTLECVMQEIKEEKLQRFDRRPCPGKHEQY